MMQQYEFTQSTDTFSSAASAGLQPSEEVLRNIRRFARSQQTVEVEEMPIVVYLN